MPSSPNQDRRFQFSFDTFSVEDGFTMSRRNPATGQITEILTIWVGGACEATEGRGDTLDNCLKGPVKLVVNDSNVDIIYGERLSEEGHLDAEGYPIGYAYPGEDLNHALFADVTISRGGCEELLYEFLVNTDKPRSNFNAIMDCTDQSCPEVFDIRSDTESSTCGTIFSTCGSIETTWISPNGDVFRGDRIVAKESGEYTVEAKFQSCPQTASERVIEARFNEEVLPEFTLSTNAPVCFDGELQIGVDFTNLEPEFGEPLYQIRGPNSDRTFQNGLVVENFTEADLGTYFVTVKNRDGCFVTKSIDVSEITFPSVDIDVSSDIACTGGAPIELTASNLTTQDFDTETLETYWEIPGVSTRVDGLEYIIESPRSRNAGWFTFVAEDQFGCRITEDRFIRAPFADIDLEILTESTGACRDRGRAEIKITGGTGPYEYHWSNGATTPSIEDLPEGEYEVTVFDLSTGCQENI